jgi:hypothetical protein
VIAVAVLLAVCGIGAVAWWWSSIVEGLRWLWERLQGPIPYIAPLVPLLSGLLTALIALAAAWIALGQMKIARLRHEAQTNADLQRRITETITKAVEQLGSKELKWLGLSLADIQQVSVEQLPD